MKPNQLKLEEVFKKNFEFQGRTEKRLFKDALYMGMYQETLFEKGLTKGQLRKAEKENIITKCYITPNRCAKASYIYIKKELGQNKLKQFIKKIWIKIKNLI
jgi:hypothetical protein